MAKEKETVSASCTFFISSSY